MEKSKGQVTAFAEEKVTYSSGNVFADLELPNPDDRLARARIASAISEIIQSRGLTQKQSATLMGIDQPKVSKIIRGQLAEFSTEWLLLRVLHMGLDVDILIHKDNPRSTEGEIRVACV